MGCPSACGNILRNNVFNAIRQRAVQQAIEQEHRIKDDIISWVSANKDKFRGEDGKQCVHPIAQILEILDSNSGFVNSQLFIHPDPRLIIERAMQDLAHEQLVEAHTHQESGTTGYRIKE